MCTLISSVKKHSTCLRGGVEPHHEEPAAEGAESAPSVLLLLLLLLTIPAHIRPPISDLLTLLLLVLVLVLVLLVVHQALTTTACSHTYASSLMPHILVAQGPIH